MNHVQPGTQQGYVAARQMSTITQVCIGTGLSAKFPTKAAVASDPGLTDSAAPLRYANLPATDGPDSVRVADDLPRTLVNKR